MLHLMHSTHACVAQHVIRVWIGGAHDLESTVAQGFVKHGVKVLLHRVVDGPLQASRCLVSRILCVYIRYTRAFWTSGVKFKKKKEKEEEEEKKKKKEEEKKKRKKRIGLVPRLL